MQEKLESETAAAAAWSEQYRSLSSRKEYAALIYRTSIGGVEQYYTGRTLAGMGSHGFIRANVVIPFLILYLFQAIAERLRRKAKITAFIHTHPKPAVGYTASCHSTEDLFLLKLPRIHAVYVIPFENLEMIVARR